MTDYKHTIYLVSFQLHTCIYINRNMDSRTRVYRYINIFINLAIYSLIALRVLSTSDDGRIEIRERACNWIVMKTGSAIQHTQVQILTVIHTFDIVYACSMLWLCVRGLPMLPDTNHTNGSRDTCAKSEKMIKLLSLERHRKAFCSHRHSCL